MTEQKYPIGVESFERLRENDMVYIDKTVYRLVSRPCYIFLSRLRRFGKSLLLSTIKAYFEGRRDLFDGLAISSLERERSSYPIFHMSFVNANIDSEDGLNHILDAHLSSWEEIYGKNEAEATPALQFHHICHA